MDGLTLTRKLRSLPDYKFTLILVLTTESGGDKKIEAESAGAAVRIVPPLNPDQLLNTIKRVMD